MFAHVSGGFGKVARVPDCHYVSGAETRPQMAHAGRAVVCVTAGPWCVTRNRLVWVTAPSTA